MSAVITTSKGDTIAFDRYGTEPTVIFVSGAGIFRAIDPLTGPTAQRIAELGAGAVFYDRLGRGESLAGDELDLSNEHTAIAALIDASNGPVVLCGHSSGCYIALSAVAGGVDAAGLILWEAPPAATGGPTREWAESVLRLIHAGDLEEALALYMKDMPPQWLADMKRNPMYPGMVANMVSYIPDAQAMAWADSGPLDDLLSGIHVPVRALYGTQTFPGMRSSAELIAATIPAATAGALTGKDHGWDVEAAAAEIVAFMQRLDAGAHKS